jgi:hypothetical protein
MISVQNTRFSSHISTIEETAQREIRIYSAKIFYLGDDVFSLYYKYQN